jgi:hypothetical protein
MMSRRIYEIRDEKMTRPTRLKFGLKQKSWSFDPLIMPYHVLLLCIHQHHENGMSFQMVLV